MSKNNTTYSKAENWANNLFLQFEIIRQNSSLSNIEIVNELIKILSAKVFYNNSNKYSEKDIHQLFENIKLDNLDYFQEHERINLKPDFLKKVLSEIDFFSEKLAVDITGVGFELFIEKVFKNSLGQFYTPSSLIKYIVEIINPKAGETIYDPCCGTGGFLTQSKKYIKNESDSSYQINNVQSNFYGNDESNLMVRVAKLNMKLHGFSNINIKRKDSLEEPNLTENKFDIVFANPPFGKIKKQYEAFEISKFTNKIELLYLEKCLNALKPGGRMGIVLPSSNLNASNLEAVRSYVESKAKIVNITNLPKEIFYSIGFSGVSSTVLFFKKFTNKEAKAYKKAKQESTSTLELKKRFDYQLFVANMEVEEKRIESNFEKDFQNIVEEFRSFEEKSKVWNIPSNYDLDSVLNTQTAKVAEPIKSYE